MKTTKQRLITLGYTCAGLLLLTYLIITDFFYRTVIRFKKTSDDRHPIKEANWLKT